MTLAEFENATEHELRVYANTCFEKAADTGPLDRPAHYREAEFYLSEIERRHNAKIVRRDLILELVIIALIVLEIVVGIYEGRGQTREARSQQEVLSNLDASFRSTASTLANLQRTTEAMNRATQEQLAFASTVRLDVAYEKPAYRQVIVSNSSAGEIAFWGSRFGSQPRTVNKEPAWFGPGATFGLPAGSLWEQFATGKPGGPERTISFELYCRNQKGLPYIVKGVLRGSVAMNGEVTLGAQTTSTLQQEWR